MITFIYRSLLRRSSVLRTGVILTSSKKLVSPFQFNLTLSSGLSTSTSCTMPETTATVGISSCKSSTTNPPTLSKEFWTLPNMITLARIAASPLLVYFIANDMKTLALAGCVLGGASDWLDGYIARNHNQMSVWGGILDPLADKVFIGCLASGLALKGLLPVWLLGVVLGRDVFLVACGIAFRALERPEGAAFFDSETATFEIVPTNLSKVNTALQFGLLGASLSHFSWSLPADLETLEPLWYLTATTTTLSGLQYLNGSGMRTLSFEHKNLTRKFTWK